MRTASSRPVTIPCLAALLALPVTATAQGWEFGGHVKGQYTYTDYRAADAPAVYGADPAGDGSLDARLKAEWRGSGFDFAVHYELLALSGDSVATRNALTSAGFSTSGRFVALLPNDSTRLFDLTHVLIDDDHTFAEHRLDRLAIGYSTGGATLRFGRQAVSWGSGLVFQVLDFVNPFPPLAIDKDYKTGEDMLYGQWQWAARSDAQIMEVARRDPVTHDLDPDQASHALKLHTRTGGFDLDGLAARHYGETLLGFGVAHSLGGAVGRFDALHTEVPDRDGVWSLLTNLDYSWVLLGKNMYGFVEYFRNGFGSATEAGYLTPDPELTARLARGELFTIGRDYLAAGLQVELAPLLNVFGNVVHNLRDDSQVVQLRGVWDARENLSWMAGISAPLGERGSEYGGVPVAPGGPYLAVGRSLFLRIAYYY